MPTFTEYINPNKTALSFTLSNWTYNLSDKFELIYKMNSAPTGNWPGLIGTEVSSSAKLYLQYNLWGGRTVLNMTYNGSYTGDGSVSYSSPYDYANYYKLSADAGNFVMRRGATLDNITTQAFTYSYQNSSGSSNKAVILFPNASGFLDMNFYSLKVWDSGGTLIHEYLPILDGIYDLVDQTSYMASTTGYINGPIIGDFYTVIFNDGAGNTRTQRIETGVATALDQCVFTKSNHEFLGWDTAATATTVVYDDAEVVTDLAATGATINLYAVWRKTWAYLLGDSQGKYYTATEAGDTQTITEVTGISTLTAADFYTNGFQFVPSSDVLLLLTNPRIYQWSNDEQPEITAQVVAVPVPQVIKTQVDLSSPHIIGITSLEALYTGNVNAAYSYDDVSYSAEMTLASFLTLDKTALYEGLGVNKMLYIKFILQDEDAAFTRFKLTYKRRKFA